MLTFVSGPVGYPDKKTIPVRWESPDVITSTLGQRWPPQQLIVDRTRNYLGPEKSHSRASRIKGETAELSLQGRRQSNRLLVDVHPSTTSDQYEHHQTNRKTETTQISREKPNLPLRLAPENGGTSNIDLSDDFCLNVVDEAFRSIIYAP